MMVKPKMFLVYLRQYYLPSSRGTQSQAFRAERRTIPYSTKGHRRCRNNTSLDVLLEKNIDDYWNVDGNREFVGCLDRFHNIYCIKRKNHPMDIHDPERDLRGNKRPQDPTMCGQKCGSICLMLRNKKKSNSASSRNQNSNPVAQLDNTRRNTIQPETNSNDFSSVAFV